MQPVVASRSSVPRLSKLDCRVGIILIVRPSGGLPSRCESTSALGYRSLSHRSDNSSILFPDFVLTLTKVAYVAGASPPPEGLARYFLLPARQERLLICLLLRRSCAGPLTVSHGSAGVPHQPRGKD